MNKCESEVWMNWKCLLCASVHFLLLYLCDTVLLQIDCSEMTCWYCLWSNGNVFHFFRVDPEENEVLDSLLDVELEVKNSASRLAENMDEKFSELTISVNHIKANVLQVVQQHLPLM